MKSKTKIILLEVLLITTIACTGCINNTYEEGLKKNNDYGYYDNNYFKIVSQWGMSQHYKIVYDPHTGVMYYMETEGTYQNHTTCITPLYNSDGTIMIYEDWKDDKE